MNNLERLAEEIKAAAARRGVGIKSLGKLAGVAHTTVIRIRGGQVPRRGTLLQLAEALGEDPARWMALAGYQAGGAAAGAPPGVEIRLETPEPPEAVLRAIREAPTREAQIDLAFEYINRPEHPLKLEVGSESPAARETAVIIWENLTGWKLLPDC